VDVCLENKRLRHLAWRRGTYGVVKERAHLHKILERELWVFGEEFNMMRSSEIGLTRMLEHHRRPSAGAPLRMGPFARSTAVTGESI
jgi:hypothetical protein